MLRGGWLREYLSQATTDWHALARRGPIDVIVLFVDHFEPGDRHGDDAAVESVRRWCEAYERLASRHADAGGRPPQHTWFHRAEYPNSGCLHALNENVFRGFGEVEFHLHHGHDTHASFAAKLRDGLAWFNRHGAMLTAERIPQTRFAYIAGNWSLDNGDGDPARSGCNTELLALRDAGCYADFTFPAFSSPAQPRLTNALYYATDTPAPKSYDTGVPVAVGQPVSGDLLIFQGPSGIDWQRGCFERAALEDYDPPDPARLDAWLDAHVHVAGRPEWVFVKLHTHGMQSRRSFLGPQLDALFAAMTDAWNRPPFRLHFVTAREAYNLVKAAEAGCAGDPEAQRDYLLPPPANRRILCDRPWRLHTWGPECVSLRLLDPGGDAEVRFAGLPLRCVKGRVEQIEAGFAADSVESLQVEAEGEVVTDPPVVSCESRAVIGIDRNAALF
jgi:hypothetical protein